MTGVFRKQKSTNSTIIRQMYSYQHQISFFVIQVASPAI
ncbi:hypothetical protein UYSO10_2983 [Kosakonia radicincitans]|nr:hypothetical protein UYSO10_2983 [Kosakonia radicincitans]